MSVSDLAPRLGLSNSALSPTSRHNARVWAGHPEAGASKSVLLVHRSCLKVLDFLGWLVERETLPSRDHLHLGCGDW
ncbi:ArsR family transcriptional regulator [Mesorhizobium sp. M1066]